MQRSKALEFAPTYLQIKKGTKETNNNFNNNNNFNCYIKDFFQKSQKTKLDIFEEKVNFK